MVEIELLDDEQEIVEKSSYDVVVYGYSIFDYARKYDPHWITLLDTLKKILPLPRHVRPHYLLAHRPNSNYLPSETLLHLFSYLDAESLLQVAQINKLWNSLSNNETLWSHLLLDKYNVTRSSLLGSEKDLTPEDTKKTEAPWSKIMYHQMYVSFRRLFQPAASYASPPVVPLQFFRHTVLAR